MTITNARIAELAEKKGVRTIAVENFLRSLGKLSERDALANLELDAELYSWNTATIRTIRAGIREAYAPAVPATKPAKKPRSRAALSDRAWACENAIQLGMGLGVAAYNVDAMGWSNDGD